MLSQKTIQFFVDLLPMIQLRADDPEFDEKAELISHVRKELNEALSEKPQPAE